MHVRVWAHQRMRSNKSRPSELAHVSRPLQSEVVVSLATSGEWYIQVALLWQRDRATRLSVEILQLQNIPIVWHYLRNPTFSRCYTIPEFDRHTHTETDGQIHDNGMYCVSIASHGKNRPYCTRHTKYNYYAGNERWLIAKCTVIITYLNDNAQAPLNRLVIQVILVICYTANFATHTVTSRTDGA